MSHQVYSNHEQQSPDFCTTTTHDTLVVLCATKWSNRMLFTYRSGMHCNYIPWYPTFGTKILFSLLSTLLKCLNVELWLWLYFCFNIMIQETLKKKIYISNCNEQLSHIKKHGLNMQGIVIWLAEHAAKPQVGFIWGSCSIFVMTCRSLAMQAAGCQGPIKER